MNEHNDTKTMSTIQRSRVAMRCLAAFDEGDSIPEGVRRYRGFFIGEQFFPNESEIDRYIEWTVEKWNGEHK